MQRSIFIITTMRRSIFAQVCKRTPEFLKPVLNFAALNRSYGSLAGVIALLFWLYASAAAILLGGELNAIIWRASSGDA